MKEESVDGEVWNFRKQIIIILNGLSIKSCGMSGANRGLWTACLECSDPLFGTGVGGTVFTRMGWIR